MLMVTVVAVVVVVVVVVVVPVLLLDLDGDTLTTLGPFDEDQWSLGQRLALVAELMVTVGSRRWLEMEVVVHDIIKAMAAERERESLALHLELPLVNQDFITIIIITSFLLCFCCFFFDHRRQATDPLVVHRLHRSWPSLWGSLQHPLHQSSALGIDPFPLGLRKRYFFRHDGTHDLLRRKTVQIFPKGEFPRHELVREHPDTPNIGFQSVLPQKDFGGDVHRGTRTFIERFFRIVPLRTAEIDQFHVQPSRATSDQRLPVTVVVGFVSRSQEEVVRLDIPVVDSCCMAPCERRQGIV